MTAAEDVRIETSPKRVRAYLDGHLVADTYRPLLVWEIPYYPTYYVPETDIVATLRRSEGAAPLHGKVGEVERHDVIVGDAVAKGAAHRVGATAIEAARGHVRLDWAAMTAWFEEDEQVYVHPRSPYTRVDICSSSRHVVVEIDGVVVAESRQPRLLFETGLPTRYYLPLTDYRLELLRPSKLITHCPYKGSASYFSVELDGTVHADVIWTYPTPLPESQKVAGLAAPYNERVTLIVDGVRCPPTAT